jgi:hypothetical protein
MGQIKIPRATTAQRTGITPDVGELIYDTTNGGVYKGDGVTAGGVALGGGSGTVTSVAASVPTFLSIAGSPITTSGTLAVTLSGTALPVLNGGTGVTTSTGSGNTVLSTSPVLTTPNIGSATGSISGNAATVTTNANLTGHITSVGNAAVLGSFTSAQLGAALTDETGTGVNVFATSPTLVTPILGSASATALTFTSTAVSGLTINKLTTAQRQALTPVMGDVVYDTTIGTTCTYTGTFWQYSKEYYVTANVTTTAITASTITGLTTFILEANSTYNIIGQFLIGCNNTGGVKFGNSLPSGGTSYISYSGASTSTAVYLQQPSNLGALTATAHNRFGSGTYLTFSGLITTAATAGSIDMQFASGTAAQTSTVYGLFSSGYQSKITLTKIA